MLFIVALMAAIATWFYIAATYQYQGYAWVDQTCDSLPSFCGSPNKVAIGCIAVVVISLIVQTMKN
jgi:uncharacterized protein involved in cysteine biosynthesis